MARNSDGVYTRGDRGGYWISWTDAQGRRRFRKTNARTLQQARSARAAELVRVEQAKAIGFAPPGEESFEDLATDYLAHQKARLTKAEYERQKGIVDDHLKPSFSCDLKAIRKVDVQRYVTKRCGEVSAGTVRKEVNVLKHMLKLAVEQWEYIPLNPAQGAKAPKAPAGRVRYLQPTELRALLEASPLWLRPVVALAACTGMRRGELLALRWLDLDIQNRRVLLPQTKNGEGRIVYLNDSAAAVIRSLPFDKDTKSTDLLFPAVTGEQVSLAFLRACRKVNIADCRFHDLRHTAASWLRMSGADIHTVAQLLGHKDLRMASRYQHLSPAFLAEAVARLDTTYGINLLALAAVERKAPVVLSENLFE